MEITRFAAPGQVGPFTVYDVTPVPGGDCLLFVSGSVSFVYDSGFGFSGNALEANIRRVLGQRNLDYILLTHSHYDHALGSAALVTAYPDAKVVAHTYAAQVFPREGARRTMLRLDDIEAARTGYNPCIRTLPDALRVDLSVTDGDRLKLGEHTVQIIGLPGHTRDCIGFYFPEDKILLGCETTGVIVSSNLVMPAGLIGFGLCLQAIDRLESIPVDSFFLSHQGMLTGEHMAQYLRISRESHAFIRDLVLNYHKEGLSQPEIVERIADTFYLPECRNIYPPAAFAENVNIMIPMLLRDAGQC